MVLFWHKWIWRRNHYFLLKKLHSLLFGLTQFSLSSDVFCIFFAQDWYIVFTRRKQFPFTTSWFPSDVMLISFLLEKQGQELWELSLSSAMTSDRASCWENKQIWMQDYQFCGVLKALFKMACSLAATDAYCFKCYKLIHSVGAWGFHLIALMCLQVSIASNIVVSFKFEIVTIVHLFIMWNSREWIA